MKAKIISASAGTGKTYSLALEYIRKLNEKVDYEEIVVITFTNKATSEIRERIMRFLSQIVFKEKEYEKLEENLGVEINRQYLKKVYEDMLKNSEKIRVSTIDSFKNKIFKTCIAPYLNVYNYKILDHNSDEYAKLILNEIITKNFETFSKFYNLNDERTLEDNEKYIKDMLDLKEVMYKFVDKKDDLIFNLENTPSLEEIVEKIELLISEYEGGKISSSYDKFKKVRSENVSIEDLVKLDKILDGRSKIGKAANEEYQEKIYDRYICPIYFNEKIIKYNLAYRELAKVVYELDDKLKLEQKAFTQNDLLYLTSKYLYDEKLELVKDGVATSLINLLGSSIHTLMIDEFQDTSILQFNLFMPIISSCKEVIIVGDEKQSIYGFRGGISKLFRDVEKILKARIKDIQIEKKSLNVCYRTRENVMEYVNDVFYKISTDENNEFKYERVGNNKKDGFVQVVNVKDYKQAADILVNTKLSNSSAFLAASNSVLDGVGKILSENNIKYNILKGTKLESDKNIKAICSLIEYLVTKNIYKLLEFLRSDLIGFSLNELKDFIELKLEDHEVIKNLKSLEKDPKDFKRKFLSYFGISKLVTKDSFLNINKFLDILDRLKSLKEFVELKNELLKSENQENVENSNSINMMTIHKSKGLEYDDTYVYLDIKKEDFKNYTLVKEYDENLNIVRAVFVKKKSVIEKVDAGSRLIDIFKEAETEDLLNKMYVALTRAKNSLVIYLKSEPTEVLENYSKGKIIESSEITTNTKESNINLSEYFKPTRIKQVKNEYGISLEQENSRKNGLAVHYFMENLKTLEDEEYAYSMFLKKYGNLLARNKAEEVRKRCIKFAKSRPDIFNKDLQIHTEYEVVFDNEIFRLDRLNLDIKNKIGYIYDYKTLKNADEELKYIKQITRYKEILEKLMPDYIFKIEILSI